MVAVYIYGVADWLQKMHWRRQLR